MRESPGDTEPLQGSGEKRGLQLLILVGNVPRLEPLPDAGVVCVGRGESADVRLDEPAVSRRHFNLRLGERVFVEDLGSANGTLVRGQQIQGGESLEVGPGDTIEIGRAMLIIQRGRLNSVQRDRFRSHDYLQERIEEECQQTGSRQFALFRLRTRPGGGEELRQLLRRRLGPSELAGDFGPDQLEVLALGLEPAEAERRLEEFAALPGVDAGLACHPRDGRHSSELFERASPTPGAQQPAPEFLQQLGPVLDRIAPTALRVLLVGETGVGKGVLALELHGRSPRRSGPFVPVHCAEFPATLLEAELFGYERGAFTGATRAKPGLVETAHGGTLFLDEVAEIPREVQVKLLRVLESGEVRRLGAVQSRPVDFRLVSASGEDLERACEQGAFRRDLFFRINGLTLWIPPLRERSREIEPLARRFIGEFSSAMGVAPPTLSPDALELLRRHPWPGNIRELRNAIERAVALCTHGIIDTQHLPSAPRLALSPAMHHGAAVADPVDERSRIAEALEACAGNQSRAAKRLGISRRTLVSKLDKHGFPRPVGRKR